MQVDDDTTRPVPVPQGGWSTGPEGAWLLDSSSGDDTLHLAAPDGQGSALDGPVVRNEAIPVVPPAEGHDAIGSVPAVSAQRRWARAQLANWRLFLVRFVCAGLAVIAAVAVVPGLDFNGWRWGQFTVIAVLFGLLNAVVKPALQFLVLRFIFNTYGVVVILINAILLGLLAAIMRDALTVEGAVPLLFGGLLVGVFGLLLETLLGANPPVLDRDYKERNGLA